MKITNNYNVQQNFKAANFGPLNKEVVDKAMVYLHKMEATAPYYRDLQDKIDTIYNCYRPAKITSEKPDVYVLTRPKGKQITFDVSRFVSPFDKLDYISRHIQDNFRRDLAAAKNLRLEKSLTRANTRNF